ncbi:MAG TPA: M28 family peptidase [Gaiellaceae bacterium]
MERPVNGRLYRSSFLLLSLPLLIAAFSVQRPAPLQRPLLPPAFDAVSTRQLADELATVRPFRTPGSVGATEWFRDQLRPYGLPTRSDVWHDTVPGIGRVRLENLTTVVTGQSPDTIVVMAHRDDTGEGPGANDNATGTAALIELARAYARPSTPSQARIRPAHTLVFLSTDGGSFGGLGALRFVESSPFRDRVVAVVNLDAIAGAGPPRMEIAGDLPRSPTPVLVQTAAHWLLEQTGARPRHPGFLGQLIDLGFPFTLYEQGPFVARGLPAVTLTTGGIRPPAGFADAPSRLRQEKLAEMGRAAQQLLGSLDQGLELAQGTTSYVWVGDRIVRGWAIELMLLALLAPVVVSGVDLFARCRRRRIRLAPAVRALRSRLAFWSFLALAFYAFDALGAWPAGAPRPPNPSTAAAGDWPVLALLALAGLGLAGWLVARHRLVPRQPVDAEAELAGQTVALLGLVICSLVVVATNPFGLLFALPALHVWLWLPQVRTARSPVRLAVFAGGLVGPALVLGSLAFRFGLGLDAPWYLLELIALGYVTLPPVAIAVGGAAAASQLAAAAAGRYAPYPEAHERGPRGPLREIVRTIVLAVRAGRRVTEERRQALGG